MKRLNRPVLTVQADDDDRDMLRTPKLTIRTIRDQHKHSTDSDSDEMDHDDPDALEGSCDIGETTLRKGPIQINRSGVTFVSSEAKTPHAGDVSVPELKRGRSERATSPPIGANPRRAIALEDLESCGLLGRGCSGHVLKAQHKQTQEYYAIKVVNNVYDKSKRDQLLTEIRTLYSVDSPYLVEFYGAYFKDHQLSLILEYCQVGSLDKVFQLAQETWIPESIVACLASQMLHGLYHLKQTHHFHRDIKPQNILVDRSGHVKLTDFGIARELGHSQDMAQTFVGTFKYMSPERVQNEPYDYKSDIWSLGLVLIECATKMFPFRHARSYIDVVQSIIECKEPELPSNTSEVSFSTEFRVFISDCLKKDPKERASVEQLLQSPWLVLHDTQHGGLQCTQRVRKWLQSFTTSETKHAEEENEYANDTFEENDEKS